MQKLVLLNTEFHGGQVRTGLPLEDGESSFLSRWFLDARFVHRRHDALEDQVVGVPAHVLPERNDDVRLALVVDELSATECQFRNRDAPLLGLLADLAVRAALRFDRDNRTRVVEQ